MLQYGDQITQIRTALAINIQNKSLKPTTMKKLMIAFFALIISSNTFAQKYQPNWESIDSRPYSAMVRGCKIWHFYPLGSLFSTCLGACKCRHWCLCQICRMVLVAHQRKK
jgi:hypothetical protein